MQLWTAATPNGWKVSIMLEELIEHGINLPEIEVRQINLSKGEQFSDEFTAHCPNQKIPVLINGEQSVMESCAILQYLAEKYPTSMLPQDASRFDVLQWLYWQAANVGPVFGNKLSYTRYMDDVPDMQKEHPLQRFGTEALRLADVLDRRLAGRDYVCGANVSIADIALYPWLRAWKWSKVIIVDHANVMAWIERMRARPGVARGVAYGVPKEEAEQWSAERKAQYRKNGATIADNARLRPDADTD